MGSSISAGDFARYPRDSLYRGLNNIMTRKDINLLAEAYKEASMTSPPSVFERALADPTNFDLHITSEEGLDWDNFEMHPVYTVYEIGSNGKYGDYEVVSNYADIEDIVDAFEKKNPQGIKDKR